MSTQVFLSHAFSDVLVRRLARRDMASTIAGAFGQERAAAADRSRAIQQARASVTVAGHALDVTDCRELLSMLGLTAEEADAVPVRDRRLPTRPYGPSAEEHVR
jgi:hypothetical protein